MKTEDEITVLPTTDLETQLLLGDLFGKARKIKALGTRRAQVEGPPGELVRAESGRVGAFHAEVS